MKIISLPVADSTNSWLARRVAEDSSECLVYAIAQENGRGQRGNSWESEPGKNLTASLLLHPDGIEPSQQFVISEGVALAVVDLLKEYGVRAKVKWPNDIYVDDSKICGILIENAVMGHSILHSIAGVGINLNQKTFLSDAPNPVSLINLTGRETDINEAAVRLSELVKERLEQAQESAHELHEEYLRLLWRGDGKLWPFYDKIRECQFQGYISAVAPAGHISITDSEGATRQYAFKEVEFILTPDIYAKR